MSFFRINGSLIKNLFGRKPADYEPAEGSDEIRGRITIDTESCTLCGKCEDHCIVGALYIDEQEETWEINRMQCILCGECTEICPQECLHMSGEPMEPEFAVIADVYHIGEVHDSEDEAETEDEQEEIIMAEEKGNSGSEEPEADGESEQE